jgi:hypothetical protein
MVHLSLLVKSLPSASPLAGWRLVGDIIGTIVQEAVCQTQTL